jgi:hypothetical protein
VPICALFPLALVCPAAFDLAWFVVVGYRSGCFATIASLGGCFVGVVVGLLSRRCFAAESDLALSRYGCFAVVGVFAFPPADVWLTVGSLTDALPLLLLDGLCAGDHCIVISFFLQAQFVGFRCFGQLLSLFSFFLFLCLIPGHSPLAWWFVICTMRTLVTVSCNSLFLMKNTQYSPIVIFFCSETMQASLTTDLHSRSMTGCLFYGRSALTHCPATMIGCFSAMIL